MKKAVIICLTVMAFAVPLAKASKHGHVSPYAGEETREIKSLSAEDIAELRRGGGWGLAKAAELNGVPGPAHLLESKDRIPLSPEQVSAIQAILDQMREAAIEEGERLVERERSLDENFRNRTVSDASLQRMLAGIEESRRALRYIHLAAHLTASPLLTVEQIQSYNALQGYNTGSRK